MLRIRFSTTSLFWPDLPLGHELVISRRQPVPRRRFRFHPPLGKSHPNARLMVRLLGFLRHTPDFTGARTVSRSASLRFGVRKQAFYLS